MFANFWKWGRREGEIRLSRGREGITACEFLEKGRVDGIHGDVMGQRFLIIEDSG